MDSTWPEVVHWDVPVALRDVCIEMLEHHRNGRAADPETVRRWHEWIHKAHRAHNALARTCEDLVEDGVTDERLAAMKTALTHAMGQEQYWARADRW